MAIGPELTEYGVNLFQFYSLITSGLLELSSMGKFAIFPGCWWLWDFPLGDEVMRMTRGLNRWYRNWTPLFFNKEIVMKLYLNQ